MPGGSDQLHERALATPSESVQRRAKQAILVTEPNEEIIQPLRVFFDTNHLVNLVHLRRGQTLRGGHGEERVAAYRTLDDWLTTGRCVPLFYEPMTYEWIRQRSETGAREIAAFLDSAITVKRVLPDPLVFVVEALNEAQRIEPRLGFPGFEVVREFMFDGDLVEWFNEHWPHEDEHATMLGHPAARSEKVTVGGFVDALAAHVRAGEDPWKVALDGSRYALTQTRETQRKHGSKGKLTDGFRRFWLKSAQRLDEVIRRMAPDLDADDLLARIDLDACPALQLHLDAYWSYAKATEEPKAGDFVDLTMFAVLAYADVALIENRMQEFARQARRSGYEERVHRDSAAMVEYVVSLRGEE